MDLAYKPQGAHKNWYSVHQELISLTPTSTIKRLGQSGIAPSKA